jgi:excisionase family DNA binding protein
MLERRLLAGRLTIGGTMEANSTLVVDQAAEKERLAYSVQEAADLLGVDYFSVYRLIQRGKLRACRALRGKLLVPRTELLRLLKN